MAYIEEANELMTDATGQSIATAIGNMSATSVGNLAALQTTDKTSLVGAVNEVKSGLTNVITIQTTESLVSVGSSWDFDITDDAKAISIDVMRWGVVDSITVARWVISNWNGTNMLYFVTGNNDNHVVLTMSYNSTTKKCTATVTEAKINNTSDVDIYLSVITYC